MRPSALLLVLLAACGGPASTDLAVDSDAPRDSEVPTESDVDLGPDNDHDGVPQALDCDDANPLVRPGATEACNGADDDCDGKVDKADAPFPGALGPFAKDEDVDGFGAETGQRWFCSQPTDGWTQTVGDCDDADPNKRPNATEICDDVDDDCDGLVDGEDPNLAYGSSPSAVFRYRDADGDGWGASTGQWHCVEPGAGWIATGGDCDDADAYAFPGSAEKESTTACRRDRDGDGFGASAPAAGVGAGGDCDDAVATTFPGAAQSESSYACRADADDDGYGSTTAPTGGTAGGDCADGNAAVRPGATETWYDGTDQNCDARDDWDQDADGYPAPSKPGGGTDCLDTNGAVNPGRTEVPYNGLDDDCRSGDQCDVDGDGALASAGSCGGSDCADTDAARKPGATEVCDTKDNDCDNLTDEADPGLDRTTLTAFWTDADGDFYGDPTKPTQLCGSSRTGYARNDTDCNDGAGAVNPNASEICNAVDDDCDTKIDDADSSVHVTDPWYFDRDGDTFPGASLPSNSCAQPVGGMKRTAANTDCDDAVATTFPGAAERESASACRADADADGYGSTSAPSGGTAGGDCDDTKAAAFPGSAERESTTACRTDADGDGYGSTTAPTGGTVGGDCDDAVATTFPGAAQAESTTSCRADADDDGYGAKSVSAGITSGGDCDDTVAAVRPGATEVWYDGVDQNCDAKDDWDQDGDTYAATSKPTGGTDCLDTNAAVNPGKTEVPYNGLDDDCRNGDQCDVDGDGVRATNGSCAGTDCADGDAARAPGLTEICDSKDNDCDNLVDQDDPGISAALLTTLWQDVDADGFGDPARSKGWCATTVSGWVGNALDCAPSWGTRHPGAEETCDLADDDCDNLVDDADPGVVVSEPWGPDTDLDGWPVTTTLYEQCVQPAAGTARYAGTADCDDQDELTFPGAAPDDSATACMTDADLDGWGGDSPAPGVTAGSDCDDLVDTIYPGAPEVFYDGIDEDCVTTNEYDADGDGYPRIANGGTDCDDAKASVHPGAVDVPGNGVDEDCSGADACSPGSSASCPATSCKAIKTQGIFTTSGTYWIQPASTAYQAACDLNTDGGGWTLVAVVSDDGQNTWTYDNRAYWSTSTTYFGTIGDGRDLRSRAMRELPMTDLLFVHRPDGVWAGYHNFGNATQDLGARIGGMSSSICHGTSTSGATTMSAGTLTTGGTLCSTSLYFNAQSSNGSSTCTSGYVTFGPTWSSRYQSGNTCPLWYPGYTSGLGPSSSSTTSEQATLGWAWSKSTNTGTSGTGANRMEVYVR